MAGALARRMAARGASDDALSVLRGLHDMFDPLKLATRTALVDGASGCLKKGATLCLVTAPGGLLYVKAASPGAVRQQETYLLGALKVRSGVRVVVDEAWRHKALRGWGGGLLCGWWLEFSTMSCGVGSVDFRIAKSKFASPRPVLCWTARTWRVLSAVSTRRVSCAGA